MDAEEVAHESFVRLWQSGLFTDDADARTVVAWLYRTSTRLALDALRRRKRLTGSAAEEVNLPCSGSLEDSVGAKHLVLALIRSVSSEELEAVILCRVDGVSHTEGAEILGVSERTVRRLLERFDAHADEWRKEFAS